VSREPRLLIVGVCPNNQRECTVPVVARHGPKVWILVLDHPVDCADLLGR
jgi:hypothetical protein